MSEQDIPNLDDSVALLPQDIRADLAERGRRDLYFFAKGVLKYHAMVPHCHMPLTIFAQENPGQYKLMLMPRDHFKSTAVTISGNLQKAVIDPNQRILIANESATNAERFLSAIRQHAESNRVFRTLYSDVIPKDTRKVKWNDQELTFNRQWIGPEPTFDTIGMTGSMTSRHYTHICIDDPISKEAVQSEKVMQETIQRLRDLQTLLVEPMKDTVWVIGTRWALFDVYRWLEEKFGKKLVRFVRAAIEDDQPIFPERFSLETLAEMRHTMEEYMFSCLMMNNPRNADIQDLNIHDLKFWRWKEDETRIELLNREGTVEEEWRLDQLEVYTTVDLAPAERASSDRNAITTCGITPSARAVVLDAYGARCTPLQVIEKLFELKARFNPRVFGIEGVAYQKAFKYFLKQECDRRGVYMRIEEIKAVGKKEIRVRGLQPVMAVGRMYISPMQHMLRSEMADFPLGEHDDVVDALSMQLQLWKGRMSPERWKKYEESEKQLLARVRNKERYLTDSPAVSPAQFDTDDLNHDDLPGPKLTEFFAA